jgi:hypothetical protein
LIRVAMTLGEMASAVRRAANAVPFTAKVEDTIDPVLRAPSTIAARQIINSGPAIREMLLVKSN